MRQPIKKVVPEPITAGYTTVAEAPGFSTDALMRQKEYERKREGKDELRIDIQDTGATTVITVKRSEPLTSSEKKKLLARYPGAIIIG